MSQNSKVVCDILGFVFNGVSSMLIGMAECEEAASGIRFEGLTQGFSPIHNFGFSTIMFVSELSPKIESGNPKKSVSAVPLTMSLRERSKIQISLEENGFEFPIIVHLPLASTVGIRFLNQILFPNICERKIAPFVNYGTCVEVSVVLYQYHLVKLLGQFYDRDLIASESGNIFFLGFFDVVDKLFAKCGTEKIDFVFVEEKLENPEFRLFLEGNFGKEKISVLKSSVLAVGAVIICCNLLKAVDDYKPWGDTEVLLSSLSYFLIFKVF